MARKRVGGRIMAREVGRFLAGEGLSHRQRWPTPFFHPSGAPRRIPGAWVWAGIAGWKKAEKWPWDRLKFGDWENFGHPEPKSGPGIGAGIGEWRCSKGQRLLTVTETPNLFRRFDC